MTEINYTLPLKKRKLNSRKTSSITDLNENENTILKFHPSRHILDIFSEVTHITHPADHDYCRFNLFY